ncbi:MAG: hypothetical protein JW786_12060 [Desulfobacterales bacterium]|nr:hypothetical protein [Desulfobacterales bacterium]
MKQVLRQNDDPFSYTNNNLYIIQAARSKPQMYDDGANFFLFCQARELERKWMVIMPHGPDVHKHMLQLGHDLKAKYGEQLLIKKVNSEFKKKLETTGYFKEVPLAKYGEKRDIALLPDDIFPESIIKFQKIFGAHLKSEANPFEKYPILKKSLRERYRSFIYRNRSYIEIVTIAQLKELKKLKDLDNLFNRWIVDLKRRYKKAQISYPKKQKYFTSPYNKMIKYAIKNNGLYPSYIIKLNGVIAGASIYGKTAERACAQYLNIADTQFRDAAEFAILYALQDLHEKYNIDWVNCGGAEYEGLHNFIQKFSPEYRQMYYMTYV